MYLSTANWWHCLKWSGYFPLALTCELSPGLPGGKCLATEQGDTVGPRWVTQKSLMASSFSTYLTKSFTRSSLRKKERGCLCSDPDRMIWNRNVCRYFKNRRESLEGCMSLQLKQRFNLQTKTLESMFERGKHALNPNLLNTAGIQNKKSPSLPEVKSLEFSTHSLY